MNRKLKAAVAGIVTAPLLLVGGAVQAEPEPYPDIGYPTVVTLYGICRPHGAVNFRVIVENTHDGPKQAVRVRLTKDRQRADGPTRIITGPKGKSVFRLRAQKGERVQIQMWDDRGKFFNHIEWVGERQFYDRCRQSR